MHACMPCMHVCHVCMYICMYACIYACMYVCMHACMYAMYACLIVSAVRLCTGEYTEDFSDSKYIVILEISRKLAMDTLHSQMVINDEEMAADSKTKERNLDAHTTCLVNSW